MTTNCNLTKERIYWVERLSHAVVGEVIWTEYYERGDIIYRAAAYLKITIRTKRINHEFSIVWRTT